MVHTSKLIELKFIRFVFVVGKFFFLELEFFFMYF
jgi:hypothetical protein